MNINIYNPYVRDELMHHGILGQKWGKRNGPPYPLFAGAHSASEKKAGWRKSLNGGSGVKYGSSNKKTSKKIDPNTIDDIDSVELMLEDPEYKYQRKELKKRFDYLAKKEVEDLERGAQNEKELKYLSDGVDNNINSSDYDKKYNAFQDKIIEQSIDWYNDIPKSERAKEWKKQRDAVLESAERTKQKLYSELNEAKKKDFLSWFTGDMFKSKKVRNLERKAWNEGDLVERALEERYDNKLVDVVLNDLNITPTDRNRHYIINSGVLFWD